MMENSVEPTVDQLEIYRRNVCLGDPQSLLAAEFGVTQQTISRYVVAVREYLRYAKREEITTLRADLTERWEAIYASSMLRAERSIRRK